MLVSCASPNTDSTITTPLSQLTNLPTIIVTLLKGGWVILHQVDQCRYNGGLLAVQFLKSVTFIATLSPDVYDTTLPTLLSRASYVYGVTHVYDVTGQVRFLGQVRAQKGHRYALTCCSVGPLLGLPVIIIDRKNS